MQLLKESLFPAISHIKECVRMMQLMLANVHVKENILEDEKYKFLFSVEEVNKLVLQGVPFRDAYKQIGTAIESNQYYPSTTVVHTHLGSIGNLCTQEIARTMEDVLAGFGFDRVDGAIAQLLAE
jgi:argininosuccinate lyase